VGSFPWQAQETETRLEIIPRRLAPKASTNARRIADLSSRERQAVRKLQELDQSIFSISKKNTNDCRVTNKSFASELSRFEGHTDITAESRHATSRVDSPYANKWLPDNPKRFCQTSHRGPLAKMIRQRILKY
jgi:hypothetical protein